jgi:hypothetical protein
MKKQKLPPAGWILVIAVCIAVVTWLVRAMFAAVP